MRGNEYPRELRRVLGVVLAALGASCNAELATMLPKAGGPYVYARRAFGAFGGFAVGWGSRSAAGRRNGSASRRSRGCSSSSADASSIRTLQPTPRASRTAAPIALSFVPLLYSMQIVSETYSCWNSSCYQSEEDRDTARNVPRAVAQLHMSLPQCHAPYT